MSGKLQPIISSEDESTIVGYMFYCPGCKSHHAPYVKPHKNPMGASWSFNGDIESPTFNPSILTRVEREDKSPFICHLFVVNGELQYLSDCTHSLAGKNIPMESE